VPILDIWMRQGIRDKFGDDHSWAYEALVRTCSAHQCQRGFVPKAFPPALCRKRTCDDTECCTAQAVASESCPSVMCSNGMVKVEHRRLPWHCRGESCTEKECCEVAGACSVHVCSTGLVPKFFSPQLCRKGTCEDVECCRETLYTPADILLVRNWLIFPLLRGALVWDIRKVASPPRIVGRTCWTLALSMCTSAQVLCVCCIRMCWSHWLEDCPSPLSKIVDAIMPAFNSCAQMAWNFAIRPHFSMSRDYSCLSRTFQMLIVLAVTSRMDTLTLLATLLVVVCMAHLKPSVTSFDLWFKAWAQTRCKPNECSVWQRVQRAVSSAARSAVGKRPFFIDFLVCRVAEVPLSSNQFDVFIGLCGRWQHLCTIDWSLQAELGGILFSGMCVLAIIAAAFDPVLFYVIWLMLIFNLVVIFSIFSALQ